MQKPLLNKVINGIMEVNKNLNSDMQIGHSYFCSAQDDEDIKMTIRYNIEPLIKQYYINNDKTAKELIEILEESLK